MPTWLKPSYIAIAVLLALLGVQSWRLASTQGDVAAAALKEQTLVADIAKARADGLAEVARREKAARDELEAKHASIETGLAADNAELKKHYDQTYGMLRDLAAQPKWSCLKDPLPEKVLNEFRRN